MHHFQNQDGVQAPQSDHSHRHRCVPCPVVAHDTRFLQLPITDPQAGLWSNLGSLSPIFPYYLRDLYLRAIAKIPERANVPVDDR